MIFVGIDIASQKHDFFISNDCGEFYKKRSVTIPNNLEGYKKLHKAINDFCGERNDYEVRIGLESTGFYHLNLLTYLSENSFKAYLINPSLIKTYKESKRVHIAKNDNIDSIYICNYLEDNINELKPYTTESYHIESLKSLSRERFNVVDELRKCKLRIYKLLTSLFPEYIKLFSNIYQGSALSIIERYPSPSKLAKAHLSTIEEMIHGKCKTTASEIIEKAKNSVGIDEKILSFQLIQAIKKLKFVQSQVDEYDEIIKEYVNMLDTKITTIPGVGYTTAGLILGEIGDINNFSNSDKLISFSGLDLRVYESGKFKVKITSPSKKGSRYLRYALYQVARIAWNVDPRFKEYYLNKKSQGVHYYVILGHIENKLLKIIYSVLKNKKEYYTYSPQK